MRPLKAWLIPFGSIRAKSAARDPAYWPGNPSRRNLKGCCGANWQRSVREIRSINPPISAPSFILNNWNASENSLNKGLPKAPDCTRERSRRDAFPADAGYGCPAGIRPCKPRRFSVPWQRSRHFARRTRLLHWPTTPATASRLPVWSENINLAIDIGAKVKAGVVWINCANLFDAARDLADTARADTDAKAPGKA